MNKTFPKTKIMSLILCFVLMIAAIAVGVGSLNRNALAAQERTSIVVDNFDNPDNRNAYEKTNWMKATDTVSLDRNNTFAQTDPYDNDVCFWGQEGADPALNIIRTSDKYYGIESIQYDLNFYKKTQDGAWCAMTFVENDTGYDYMVPNLINYKSLGGYARSNTYGRGKVIVPVQYADNASTYKEGDPYSIKSANIGKYLGLSESGVLNEWITVKYVMIEEKSAEKYAAFDIYMWVRGGEMPAEPICRTTVEIGGDFKSASITNGVQLRFIWNNNVWMDNVVIDCEKKVDAKGAETPVSEPVVETFTYGLQDMEKSVFRTVKTSFNTYVYGLGHYQATNGKAFARLMASRSVAEDKSTLVDFEVINAKFLAKVDSGKSAFLFGVKGFPGKLDDGAYAVEFIKTTDGAEVSLVKYYKEKQEIKSDVLGTLPAYSVGSEWAEIEISVNKNGKVTVYENGMTLGTLEGVQKYSGSCGLMIVEEGTNASFDNVDISSYIYDIPTTKSVSTDFENDYLGPVSKPDFVMGVNNSNTYHIADGELVYKGAIRDDFLAANYEYDTFVVEYKITSILSQCSHSGSCDCAESTPSYNWIGLDIGRKNASVKLGSYCSLGFYIAKRGPAKPGFIKAPPSQIGSIEQTMVIDGQEITVTSSDISYELFRGVTYDGVNKLRSDVKASDAVCVKWVGNGNSIELYLKTAGEIEYVKYMTVNGINTSGYLALVNNNVSFFTLDDVVVTNTSPIYYVPTNLYPDRIILEKDEEYNPNDYRQNDDLFEEELSYLKDFNYGGCGSSVSGSIVVPSIILGIVAFVVIAMRRSKHEENNN